MANLTITVNSTVGVFGGSLTNKWNVYNWNAFTWGEGSPQDLVVAVEKLIANTASPTSDVGAKHIEHVISASDNSTSWSTAVFSEFTKLIDCGTVTTSFETSNETLSQGIWSYIFPSNASNLEDRDMVSWTSGTVGSTTWTTGTAGSTTWS
jgi:hypothetical protein